MGCNCQKQHPASGDDCVKLGQYIGEKNCFGLRNGRGQYYYLNGDIYDGAWKRNEKYGYGIYIYADGRRLLGYFESGRYLGEFAPSDIEEDQDEPLLANTGLRTQQDPLIPRAKQERERRRRNRNQRIEELRQKWGIKKPN